MILKVRYFFICIIVVCSVWIMSILYGLTSDSSCPNVDYHKQLQYVVSFDDSVYQVWQAEVLLHNFKTLGIAHQLWFVILYDNKIMGPSETARNIGNLHGNNHHVRFYHNDFPHDWKSYKAVCKSYGVAKLLTELPALGQCIFVMDADVMLTRAIRFTHEMMQDDCIYGSNTSNYLSFRFLHNEKKLSVCQLTHITELVGPGLIDAYRKGEDRGIIGAQYLFKNVDASFFLKIANDAWNIYQYACQQKTEGSLCQTWMMGDMLSFLLNSMQRVGRRKVKSSSELDFSWATRPIQEYHKNAIIHWAGVTKEDGQFDKRRYTKAPPWAHTNFDYITNPHTLAQIWLERIQEYCSIQYGIRLIVPC